MNVRQIETTYVSRTGGQHLDVNLAHPELSGWLSIMRAGNRFVSTLEQKITQGIDHISIGMRYDAAAQAEGYKKKHITATKMSKNAGLLFYSSSQTEAHESSSLGYLLPKNAMVCREKAMLTHLFLAELGIPTWYQPGSVKQGERPVAGHAWAEWIEPASVRGETVEAVIDGTWGKVYTNYSYDKTFVVEKLDWKVYFEPIEVLDAAVIADAFARIAQAQAING